MIIGICAKVSDNLGIRFTDDKGHLIGDTMGYVPDFFPEEHYGDYIIFDIDAATGQILNWIPVDETEAREYLKEEA